MKSLYLLLSLLFINITYPQVPILFYDFENNTNKSVFENVVEQSINSGSGPITRVGSGTITSGLGNNSLGCGLYSSSWQNVVTDPGTAATEYYQMTVKTTGFKGISIKFRFYIPFQTGPGNFGVLISSNGTTYKKTGSFNTGGPNNSWGDVGFSFYNYPEANNINSLSIRLYAFKGANTNSGGLMAIDNLMITADTVVSNAGNITLLNESDIYNSFYSGSTGQALYRANFVINGPGSKVTLTSPLNILQNFIITNGATLECGNFPLWGYGSFNLNKGGTLNIGSPQGITLTDSVGNICLKGTRSYNSGANYIYNGSSPQLTGNGLPATLNCISINNSSGVTLSNSLQVADTLKLLAGKLILGDRNLTINDTSVVSGSYPESYVVTNNSGVMIYNSLLRNTDIKIPVGTTDSYNPVLINYTGTVDTFKASVKPAFDHPPVDNNRVVNRQWAISENNAGGSLAALKLFWVSDNEAAGFNASSQVMIGRFDGSGWFQVPALVSGNGTVSDPYTASVSGITQFYPFGIGNDGALPVELLSFNCQENNNQISLFWKTATEINSNRFEIERKTLSENKWVRIGIVHANFLSNSPKSYSFIDRNINNGEYQYRLKIIDNDGSFIYSKIIEAKTKVPGGLELCQNFPNPFNPSTRINYNIPFDSEVLIEVFNILGTKIAVLANEFKGAGHYYVDFTPSFVNKTISSGVYYYRISTLEKGTGMRNAVMKKMMFIK
jgi:hypothetical protein